MSDKPANPFNRALNLLFDPLAALTALLQGPNLLPAWTAWGVTTMLFSMNSVLAALYQIPLSEAAPLGLAHYRYWQAALMPVILGTGCALGVAILFWSSKLFARDPGLRPLIAVAVPALLVPTWPILWPTDLAVSLGVFGAHSPGFPGLWVRELVPALTFIYMLTMLWMAVWKVIGGPLRESFALAVLGLVPVLGLWALVLR